MSEDKVVNFSAPRNFIDDLKYEKPKSKSFFKKRSFIDWMTLSGDNFLDAGFKYYCLQALIEYGFGMPLDRICPSTEETLFAAVWVTKCAWSHLKSSIDFNDVKFKFKQNFENFIDDVLHGVRKHTEAEQVDGVWFVFEQGRDGPILMSDHEFSLLEKDIAESGYNLVKSVLLDDGRCIVSKYKGGLLHSEVGPAFYIQNGYDRTAEAWFRDGMRVDREAKCEVIFRSTT